MRKTKVAGSALVLSFLVTGIAYAEGDAVRGEAQFKECAACHKLAAGANEVGPSLHGIFSRKAGELADFRYSPAMKRSGVTWTAESLDKYLADPQALCRDVECRRSRRPHRLSSESDAVGRSPLDSFI